MDIGVGVGRCANVTNYMCCRGEDGQLATRWKEMKDLCGADETGGASSQVGAV